MLKDEVVNAVRDGQFHIWSVRTVDEASRYSPGQGRKRTKGGAFQKDSIHDLVDRKIGSLSETWVSFGENHGKKANRRKSRRRASAQRSKPEAHGPARTPHAPEGGSSIWISGN
jgi:hypothetical protein